MLYVKARSVSRQQQFLVTLRMGGVYLFHVFKTTIITLEISTGFMLVRNNTSVMSVENATEDQHICYD
jgi:hypothetical protein